MATLLNTMASTICARARSPAQQNTMLVMPSTRPAMASPLDDCCVPLDRFITTPWWIFAAGRYVGSCFLAVLRLMTIPSCAQNAQAWCLGRSYARHDTGLRRSIVDT